MRTLHLVVASLALSSAFPAGAATSSSKACLPSDIALARDHSDEWLSRRPASEIRAHLASAARGGSWAGDVLSFTCSIQGSPPREDAITVSNAGSGIAAVQQVLFSRIAAAAGRTPEEGDELSRKYAALGGAFFRAVRDDRGSEVGEDELILRRHEQKLGIVRPTEADLGVEGTAKKEQQARGRELREKIKAAKARGDMAEMMRLAGEGRALSTPVVEKAVKVQERTDRQTWDLLQSAHADLAHAAFRTKITFVMGPCLPCLPPEPPSR